mmetsp:Transcript_32050/g.50342  ORF Transcript_32050/g.50342 Transcript_32050/m.50342 type:complete len:323 (+) Transcript_32050:52-1020(+)
MKFFERKKWLLLFLAAWFLFYQEQTCGFSGGLTSKAISARRQTFLEAQQNEHGHQIIFPQAVTRDHFIGLASLASYLAAGLGSPALAAPETPVLSPKITHKVFIDIQIASILNESNNFTSYNDYKGRLVFGLWGEAAPRSVRTALRYFDAGPDPEAPGPTYARGAAMTSRGPTLLEGGRIKGLQQVNIAGSLQYEYRGKVIVGPSAFELSPTKHNRRGLLTRDSFSTGPEFGVTLADAPELDDGRRVVFGELLEGEDVLQALELVPTYQAGSTQPRGSLADDWYRAQRDFFLRAGQAAGDERAVGQVNKLLRRVDIKACGML